VQIQPTPTGGYSITVEVYKELEDLQKPVYSSFGGGSLIKSNEPVPQQILDEDVPPGLGWISLGRDPKLEARILADLRSQLGDTPIGTR
jgi:hypothetical protein